MLTVSLRGQWLAMHSAAQRNLQAAYGKWPSSMMRVALI